MIKKLKSFFRRFFSRKEEVDLPEENISPFLAKEIILRNKFRSMKINCLALAVIAVAAFFFQQRSVHKLLKEIARKETIIVPGAPDFMKLRVGSIPDEVIFSFAEYAARNLGTFSFRTMEGQYKEIAEHMAPELKHTFIYQAEKKFEVIKELRVDEIFEFSPVTKFGIRSDDKGTRYIVEVRGSTKKYMEGNLRETVPTEIMIFELSTTPITAKKPWMLVIENFRRTTPLEEEKRTQIRYLEKN